MIAYAVAMLVALSVNLVIEGMIVIPMLRRYLPLREALMLFVAMNALTMPIVWVFVPAIIPQQTMAVAVSEAITFLAEGLIAAQVAPPADRLRVILRVWFANTVTLVLGIMIGPIDSYLRT